MLDFCLLRISTVTGQVSLMPQTAVVWSKQPKFMNFPPLYADIEKDHKKVRFDPKKKSPKKVHRF